MPKMLLSAAIAILVIFEFADGSFAGAATGSRTAQRSDAVSGREWPVKVENIIPHGTNPYFFPLVPGHKHIQERPDHPDGRYRKETVVLDEVEDFELPDIGKFKTAVVQEEEYTDGALTQRTRKWLALDGLTNSVYAFGEVNWDIEEGGHATFADTWRVGEPDRDGKIVLPAVVMPGALSDVSGNTSGKIESGVEISVPAGKFKNCIRFREPGQLFVKDIADTVWCPAIGVVFDPNRGKLVASNALPKDNSASNVSSFGKLRDKPAGNARPVAKITTDEAKKIALQHMKGKVTEIKIERKLGKRVYVVEMQTADGEKDVFVDIENGKVVGTD